MLWVWESVTVGFSLSLFQAWGEKWELGTGRGESGKCHMQKRPPCFHVPHFKESSKSFVEGKWRNVGLLVTMIRKGMRRWAEAE